LTYFYKYAILLVVIKNHIVFNDYTTRQGNLNSPKAVLNGMNDWAIVRQHRQCILDFQKK